MTPSRQAVLDGILARRERHRRRRLPVRIASAFVGFVIAAVSLPLLIVLPELGVPLLLWALSILAVEFDWAARAYATVTWHWQRVHAWFKAQGILAKTAVVLATLLVAIGLLALLFLH